MKRILSVILICSSLFVHSQELRELAAYKPIAIGDLKSSLGSSLLHAKWYVQNAKVTEAAFQAPGASEHDAHAIYPTGRKIRTNQIRPQITDADFNTGFKPIQPEDLESRQGNGLISFVWYKVEIQIPDSIGKCKTEGTTAVFEIVMDDYSEIWVNGKQNVERHFGLVGEGAIGGYNAVNRVVLSKHARAGEKYTIAILGINGTLGMIPDNYIWVRNAVVDFYKDGLTAGTSWTHLGKIYEVDKQLEEILPKESSIDKIAEGFQFTEGPVWHPDGYLLFSDPNANTIYRYNPVNNNINIYMSHSGYTGPDIGEYGQPGSNGLTIDKEGRLIIDQHGNRRVIRIEKKGPVTVLADKIDGKRLNSPNDIVQKSDGTIYFTDPPYGLPHFFEDSRKELDYSGVFMIKNGKTQLVSKDLGGPNGLAFSPDEKYFYVTNWDIRDIHHTKTIWRYEVNADGTLKNGMIFFDCNQTEDEEGLDGMKVDRQGNLFVSAPGGVWIISKEAKLLGKMILPERPSNMAWGDEDGKTLYFTDHGSLYKVRVNTGGKFAWE